MSPVSIKARNLGVLASCAAGLTIAFLLTGLPLVTDYSRGAELGIAPDVLHERAIAWESIWGDPYRRLSDIMPGHGYPESQGGVSPRTPAALLLQVPLLVVSDGLLMPVITMAVLVMVLVVLWLTHRISQVDWKWIAWAGPLIFFSHPVVTAISYGSFSVMLTVVLVLTAWAFQDEDWSGIPLGLAAAMRLWPGLAVVGFWLSGRRRAAYVAATTFVLFNVLGLLLPGVTLEGSVQSLLVGAGNWVDHNQNASLAALLLPFGVPVLVPTVIVSLLGLWLAHRNRSRAIPICVVTALIASPLSWPAYLLVALPVLALWWREGGGWAVALVSAPFLFWVFTPTEWKGHIGLVALSMMLVATIQKTRRVSPKAAVGPHEL